MKKILSFISLGALFVAGGCSKFVEGYDVSPNRPSDVSLEILLTGTEVATFSSYTGQLARISSLLVNQSSGLLFQFEEFTAYDIKESSIDNEWQQLYNGGMINANIIIDKAGDDFKIYRGIARVLKAMNLGLATDMWGDVPNTQALNGFDGEANFNPAYDAQDLVIRDIQALLDAAISDLNSDPGSATDNKRVPSTDDLIFGGDNVKWRLAARVLKARYANRLSKREAANSATTALGYLDAAYTDGLADGSSDMMAPFGEAATEWNQWYAFEQQRAGYVGTNTFFFNMLDGDPRQALYTSGAADGPIGAYFASQDSPLPLVTYFEAKFIEAEAALRASNPGRAATAYNAAVTANLAALGIDDPAYLAANAAETSGSITLDKIMKQKYIAMFTQPEVWSDWRRTNLPALTPNAGALITEIPRRMPTAQNERLYNSNAQVVADLTQRIWWDQ